MDSRLYTNETIKQHLFFVILKYINENSVLDPVA